MLLPLLLMMGVALKLRRHTKGVAEFMAGGRLAGRYLVCNARGEMGMAVISVVGCFEMFHESGFTLTWWNQMTIPLSLLVGLTGYVIYRYRETRAMTLAQFFETRYSRSFRIFAGSICFLSGLINYGVFPAVNARFLVCICGLPQELHFGDFAMPTFIAVMAIYLSLALLLSLSGGQLTIMVTDCIEGLLGLVFMFVILCALLVLFDWNHIRDALLLAPPGKSMLNPFDIGKAEDFNIWFVLIGMFGSVYGVMAWQGGHAFNSCAKNAHEAKMGAILGTWRNMTRGVMYFLLAICAVTLLKHPDFSAQALKVDELLGAISDPQIQSQMRMPTAVSIMFPVAIKGMLCSLMLFAILSCDCAYLHSWGGIFIQDIVIPLRGERHLSPETHIRLLRWAIVGVAAFGFLFSLFFHQTEYLLMFFALTGAIFLGGAGAVIAGGLYWKKGTAAGAWAAMVSGSGLAVGGMLLQQCWKDVQPHLALLLPDSHFIVDNPAKFPINGQILYFFAMATAVALFIVVSLLTCRRDFNMEKLLHRGKYAIADDQVPTSDRKTWSWMNLIGIDENFTSRDKAVSISVFAWSMFWWGMFLVGTVWNIIAPWPVEWWVCYWRFYAIIIPLLLGSISTVWFLWGGIHDLRTLFTALRSYKSGELDDGEADQEKDGSNPSENSAGSQTWTRKASLERASSTPEKLTS